MVKKILITLLILLFYIFCGQESFAAAVAELKLKDSEIYVGDKWTPKDNFISAADKYGNDIPWGDPRIKVDIGDFNNNREGKYAIEYRLSALIPGGGYGYDSYVTVKKSYQDIKLKDSVIYAGDVWDPKDNFISATDDDGNEISWGDPRIEVDKGNFNNNREGKYAIKYKFRQKENYKTAWVTVKKDSTSIKTKDSTLYVGQKFDPKDNFISATDEDGKSVSLGDPRIIINDEKVDASKPGIYQGKYTIKGKVKDIDSSFTVTVKEDKTKLKLIREKVLFIGDKWDPSSIFEDVQDKDGNRLTIEQIDEYYIEHVKTKEMDTSKPHVHHVYVRYPNAQNQLIPSNTSCVYIKEDKVKVELRDDRLYTGENWDLSRVYKKVIGKDGKYVSPDQIPTEQIWIDGKNKREIDTSKPGSHLVQIALLNEKNELIKSNEVKVIVKEERFTLEQVPYFDFEDNIIESTNKTVINKKENPTIELETPGFNGIDWQLQVELFPFLDKNNEKKVLKGVSLSIPKGKLESDMGSEEDDPIQYNCKLEANGKASILMHGTKTKGKGRWKNKLETKDITLSIPPGNKLGNYESTLHWTLLDVPG